MKITIAPHYENVFEVEGECLPEPGTLITVQRPMPGTFTEIRKFRVLHTVTLDEPPRIVCEAADKE